MFARILVCSPLPSCPFVGNSLSVIFFSLMRGTSLNLWLSWPFFRVPGHQCQPCGSKADEATTLWPLPGRVFFCSLLVMKNTQLRFWSGYWLVVFWLWKREQLVMFVTSTFTERNPCATWTLSVVSRSSSSRLPVSDPSLFSSDWIPGCIVSVEVSPTFASSRLATTVWLPFRLFVTPPLAFIVIFLDKIRQLVFCIWDNVSSFVWFVVITLFMLVLYFTLCSYNSVSALIMVLPKASMAISYFQWLIQSSFSASPRYPAQFFSSAPDICRLRQPVWAFDAFPSGLSPVVERLRNLGVFLVKMGTVEDVDRRMFNLHILINESGSEAAPPKVVLFCSTRMRERCLLVGLYF